MRTPTVPGVDPVERPRLSRQCQAILERLQRGPATNLELSGIALKYTGRISDLRRAGYRIEQVDRDYTTGRTTYALRPRVVATQMEMFS